MEKEAITQCENFLKDIKDDETLCLNIPLCYMSAHLYLLKFDLMDKYDLKDVEIYLYDGGKIDSFLKTRIVELLERTSIYIQNHNNVSELCISLQNIKVFEFGVFLESLYGNTSIKTLNISYWRDLDYLITMIQMLYDLCRNTHINKVDFQDHHIFRHELPSAAIELDRLCSIPVKERLIPVRSKTKSAAKSQNDHT